MTPNALALFSVDCQNALSGDISQCACMPIPESTSMREHTHNPQHSTIDLKPSIKTLHAVPTTIFLRICSLYTQDRQCVRFCACGLPSCRSWHESDVLERPLVIAHTSDAAIC